MGDDRPHLFRDDGDQEGGVEVGQPGARGRAAFRLAAAVGESCFASLIGRSRLCLVSSVFFQ